MHTLFIFTDNLAAKEGCEVKSKSTNKVPAGNDQIDLRFDYDGGYVEGGAPPPCTWRERRSEKDASRKHCVVAPLLWTKHDDLGSDTGTAAAPD